MNKRFIAIAGNIGVGKSTLTGLLSDTLRLGAVLRGGLGQPIPGRLLRRHDTLRVPLADLLPLAAPAPPPPPARLPEFGRAGPVGLRGRRNFRPRPVGAAAHHRPRLPDLPRAVRGARALPAAARPGRVPARVRAHPADSASRCAAASSNATSPRSTSGSSTSSTTSGCAASASAPSSPCRRTISIMSTTRRTWTSSSCKIQEKLSGKEEVVFI